MTHTLDNSRRTIHFERLLDAPPDDVFDAWTRPERVSCWWDPTGAPLTACTIDLRPQGAFRFVTAQHGPPFEGTYAVVERPHRLEFHAMGAHGVITLAPEGGGTRMRVSIQSPSAEHFEMFVKLGVAEGTGRTLDNLVRSVARTDAGAAAG